MSVHLSNSGYFMAIPSEFVPRHISSEIQRVEREFQNQQVEVRLVAALGRGLRYLDTEKFTAIDVNDLEDVCSLICYLSRRNLTFTFALVGGRYCI